MRGGRRHEPLELGLKEPGGRRTPAAAGIDIGGLSEVRTSFPRIRHRGTGTASGKVDCGETWEVPLVGCANGVVNRNAGFRRA
jgi:hypothetical protein